MKNIFYTIPIFLISKSIYIALYGEFVFSITDVLDYLSIRSLFGLIIFCSIYVLCYFIERVMLPNIFMFVNTKKRSKSFFDANKSADKTLNKIYSENPLYSINKGNKLFYLKEFMFIPICIVLWAIAFYSTFSLIIIPLTVISVLFYVRIINTHLNK
jgi:hypothetical protein